MFIFKLKLQVYSSSPLHVTSFRFIEFRWVIIVMMNYY